MNSDIPLVLEREAGMHESIPQVAVGFGMHAIKVTSGEQALADLGAVLGLGLTS